MLQFPITEKAWNDRQSATLTIDLYHQAPLTIVIPKTAAALTVPAAAETTAPASSASSSARHHKPATAKSAPAEPH